MVLLHHGSFTFRLHEPYRFIPVTVPDKKGREHIVKQCFCVIELMGLSANKIFYGYFSIQSACNIKELHMRSVSLISPKLIVHTLNLKDCTEKPVTAVNEAGIPILEIQPGTHHQRTALYVGSKELVEDIARVLRTKK
jgi:hypothetical protein